MVKTLPSVLYAFLKHGVYCFAIMMIAFFHQGVYAASFTMICEGFHAGGSIIKVDKAGSENPTVTIKVSGRAAFEPRILSADQFEIIWRDGWGPTFKYERGLCGDLNKKHCPTEKRLGLALHGSKGNEYLTVTSHYGQDCCREYQDTEWAVVDGEAVNVGSWHSETFKKGDQGRSDSCDLTTLIN